LPVLRGERLLLREVQHADAGALLNAIGDPEVYRFLSSGPQSLAAFVRFIDWARAERHQGRYFSFAIVPAGARKAVGLLQVWPVEPSLRTAEWGFVLGRASWGTGVFTESAHLLIDYLFGELGVRRLEARAAVTNGRGRAALRKLGAVEEGTLRECFLCGGRYEDHTMYSILAREWKVERSPLPSAQRA
jgi:N-acetyltransferase